MKRSGPLRRITPLRSKTRLRPISKKRKRQGVDPDLRQAVLDRDMGCVAERAVMSIRCWGRLDPHHMLRRSQGGKDEPGNLITLCRAHHDWVHANPKAATRIGLLRSRSRR